MDSDQSVVHDLVQDFVPVNTEEPDMPIAEQWQQQGREEGLRKDETRSDARDHNAILTHDQHRAAVHVAAHQL